MLIEFYKEMGPFYYISDAPEIGQRKYVA